MRVPLSRAVAFKWLQHCVVRDTLIKSFLLGLGGVLEKACLHHDVDVVGAASVVAWHVGIKGHDTIVIGSLNAAGKGGVDIGRVG